MAPYDEWNKLDEDDEDELQDSSAFEGKKDVILFAIDCSKSMLELRDDPNYEDSSVKTCNIMVALDAAIQIQKKKVIVGPNDSVGVMFYNTSRKSEGSEQGSEIKRGNFIFQSISPISAPKVQELSRLLDAARLDPDLLRETFPPLAGTRVPMGDVFTSCNWIMRDGAPKTATKRIFLITDEDDPNPGLGSSRLLTSAKTTLIDLTQAGITIEPFFISTDEKLFDVSRYYSNVLIQTEITEDEDSSPEFLPESVSITRIEDLLAQMRFHEVPKRALFSVPFHLAEGFTIGVKGYGLVTEQRKGTYKYFIDRGDGMEAINTRTDWVDKTSGLAVKKDEIMYGASLGETVKAETVEDDGDSADGIQEGSIARAVPLNVKVFYTADEVKSFRTLGLEPQLKLLGFKTRKSLRAEDNVKHSIFIYPDEMSYSGSRRTFSALVTTMIKKKRIGLVLAMTRRNATPTFCAMIPQAEKLEEGGWVEPAGFHLITLPFADDIRAAPDQVLSGARASDELKDKAFAWLRRLQSKGGKYPPDSYPNPALAYHNAQLEASAFREEFDPESFRDLTQANYEIIQQRVGHLIKQWKETLREDETANTIILPSGPTKRKADSSVDEADLRRKYENGELSKLRVDQLKEYLKSKGLAVSGKKSELIERVGEYLDTHL
ncbi:SPOC like C-terminal domain-containing protein [Irpex rosettiformis]|uniref:SPOC like C-terminal domain-containing protein n=1 Tax=Irpex rosettiformis TaxID=378272 RepID=A0ACB8U7T9_9APHY|nr:SPOC like C-terminal domain-containing protein [Irpex rosettiformis]